MHYTCDPKAELYGHSAHALLESINVDNYVHVLEEHGLTQIDRSAWYPLQAILNVLNDIASKGGSMMDFVSIGMAAGTHAVIQPEVQSLSIEEFLLLYPQHYQRMHRGNVGEIQVRKAGPNHLEIVMRIPYPDDLFYGIFYAYIRRIAPPNTDFRVNYDDKLPTKDNGGEFTLIHVVVN